MLAMAVGQATSLLTVPASSRASLLLRDGGRPQILCTPQLLRNCVRPQFQEWLQAFARQIRALLYGIADDAFDVLIGHRLQRRCGDAAVGLEGVEHL